VISHAFPSAIAVAAILFCAAQANAEQASPVGLWKTIDDKTDQPRSIVRIVEEGGQYKGTIEKGLRADDDPERLCDKCPGEFHNKRVRGMTFMWGFKQDGKQYTGGQILDPENGKIYRCKMRLANYGKELHVRGYIGVSLLGRTQVWLREQ
jgi:uncharacterized protein (DUF2147 family)